MLMIVVHVIPLKNTSLVSHMNYLLNLLHLLLPPESKKHADRTGNIELINLYKFQRLMNEFFGSKWQLRMDYIISDSLKDSNY